MLVGLKGTPAKRDPHEMLELACAELAARPIVPLKTLDLENATLEELHQQKRAREVNKMVLAAEMQIINRVTNSREAAAERDKAAGADPKLNQNLIGGK
jgi:hypothetical protein